MCFDMSLSALNRTSYFLNMSMLLPSRDSNGSSTLLEDTIWDVVKDFQASLVTYHHPGNIVLIVSYSIVFLVALLGNLLVIVVARSNRSMRNVTNYFLLNLAISDLLVTVICIPFTVCQLVYRVWIYGEFLCKATGYLQGVSVGSSVMTIMFLSLDRYFAIRHPVKSRRITTTGHVTAVVVLIWAVSCGIMTPLATARTLNRFECINGDTVMFCVETWPSTKSRRIFDTFLFVFIYILPGTVVGLSYTSTGRRLIHGDKSLRHQGSVVYSHVMAGRRRVARMLLLLAVLFAVSWMPYYVISLYVDFGPKDALEQSLVALSFALLLGHSHSAQNPILYCTMNRGFQKAVAAALRCDEGLSRSKDTQQTNRMLGNDSSDTKRETFNCSRGAARKGPDAAPWSNRGANGDPQVLVVYSTFNRGQQSARSSFERASSSSSRAHECHLVANPRDSELIRLKTITHDAHTGRLNE